MKLKITLSIIGVLFVVVALFWINGYMDRLHANPGAVTVTPTASANVGQSITVNGLSTTLLAVQRLDEQTVAVKLKITNNGTVSASYSKYAFSALSNNTTIYLTETQSSGTSDSLIDVGTLTPGQSVIGDVLFQVPQGKQAWLIWTTANTDPAGLHNWDMGI